MPAKRIHIKGLVQGVGFRPFIYRTAVNHNLKGWVENRNDGLIIHVEGNETDLEKFLKDIPGQAPEASNIFSIDIESISESKHTQFFIKKSENRSDEITEISPDIAVCEECLKDMKEQDHRLDYPFINCTNCGPRFTIIKDLPYDRDKTTMDPFLMCDTCRYEYGNIMDRRFHAQPVACNNCGPEYQLFHKEKTFTEPGKILEITCTLLEKGKIMSIKGLGGFHLACDAQNDKAVSELRKRKNRDGKPFAVMFRDVTSLREFLEVSPEEEQQLLSWRRPIMLLKNKTTGLKLADDVSVGFNTTGAMLPYMPFHYLLFERLKLPVIVLTSGNIADEPIIIDNDEALIRLKSVADSFLIYNRDIYNRTDDSVQMVTGKKNRLIRRSRGYVPNPVHLKIDTEGILATGAELVNCFCIGKGKQAIMSQHIGDLKNIETLGFYTEAVGRFQKLFRVSPTLIVHDMHPDYLSTRFANEIINSAGEKNPIKSIAVQHHHAHIASCMAEHELDEKVIGVSFDGTGYGDDGNIWGGEFFECDLQDYERITHFDYVPMPGGDKATKQPWRMGIAYLYRFYGRDLFKLELEFIKNLPEDHIQMLMMAIDNHINCPVTSSAGRLFDAVAAIMSICTHSSFHAEAPMRLESIIDDTVKGAYDFELNETIVMEKTIRGIVEDLLNGNTSNSVAAKFHNTIINIIFAVVESIREKRQLRKVVLSGGSFQNRYILERIENRLSRAGYEVYSQSRIPSNDGGIALGQLAIAARRRAES